MRGNRRVVEEVCSWDGAVGIGGEDEAAVGGVRGGRDEVVVF